VAGRPVDLRVLRKGRPNLLVAHYLMACFAYYREDDPIMSDEEFEDLWKELAEKWDQIEHPHRDLCGPKDSLMSGFDVMYPPIVKHAVAALRGPTRPPAKPSGFKCVYPRCRFVACGPERCACRDHTAGGQREP
jgi:hypothetical protein